MPGTGELSPGPRTKGSGAAMEGPFQKAAGRLSSHERLSMYGKRKRAKQNKQRQQKGIISINSFFKCVGQTPRRKMLWDKHLFLRNATGPPTGSVACVCPHAPEVHACASTRRRPRRRPRERPDPGQDTLHGLQLGCWRVGEATLTQSCWARQKPHRREQIPTLRMCRTALLCLHRFPPTWFFNCLHQSDQPCHC